VRTSELYEFLYLLASTGVVVLAWTKAQKTNKFPLSLSSAYRWRNIFTRRIHHYRAKLFQQIPDPPPDEKYIASPRAHIEITIKLFDEANIGKNIDSFSAFQLHHQEGFYQ
jgi:hypothetical protein